LVIKKLEYCNTYRLIKKDLMSHKNISLLTIHRVSSQLVICIEKQRMALFFFLLFTVTLLKNCRWKSRISCLTFFSFESPWESRFTLASLARLGSFLDFENRYFFRFHIFQSVIVHPHPPTVVSLLINGEIRGTRSFVSL
jgi:hypothetical protein